MVAAHLGNDKRRRVGADAAGTDLEMTHRCSLTELMWAGAGPVLKKMAGRRFMRPALLPRHHS
jgi:hypothetical protein